VYDPDTDKWATVAPMPTARSSLAAGVVGGKLYALGGSLDSKDSQKLDTVEVYDPYLDTWDAVAPMPTARGFLAAGVVDGKLYALGGSTLSGDDDNSVATVERYDPNTGEWTNMDPMPTARINLAAGVVGDKLYALGGYSYDGGEKVLDTVEVYDPAANTWAALAQMPTARSGLVAGVVGGKLYAAGGGNVDDAPLDVLEVLVPGPPPPSPPLPQGTWSEVAPMPTKRDDPAVAVWMGPEGARRRPEKLFAIGGLDEAGNALQTVELYDPSLDEWESAPFMPTARFSLAAAVVGDKLYALGGSSDSYTRVDTVERYDPYLDTWDAVAPMPTARGSLAAGVVDGKLYALGGYDSMTYPLDTVEVYDPATDTWAAVAPMPTARFSLAAAVVGGKLYALGGLDGTGGYKGNSHDTVEVYNPATDTWAAVAPMPTARGSLAAGVVDGKLYALGGIHSEMENHTSYHLDTVEVYDPATNTWAAAPPMPPTTPSSRLAAGVLDGKLYALGENSLQVYDPSPPPSPPPPQLPLPPTPPPSSPKTGVAIGAAAGGVALLASVAAAIVIKRRRALYCQQAARLTMARASASLSLASV